MGIVGVLKHQVNIGVADFSTFIGGICGFDNFKCTALQHLILGDFNRIAHIGNGLALSPLQLVGLKGTLSSSFLSLDNKLNCISSGGRSKQAVILELKYVASLI